jgi:RND family efflux transporter MFP subunit
MASGRAAPSARRVPAWIVAGARAAAGLGAAACDGDVRGDEGPVARPPVLVGQENVLTVRSDTVVAGPIISGELRPREEVVLRAQVGGALIEVLADEGQAVRRGATLARIEASSLDDARRSALSAIRSAEQALRVARREVERAEMLVEAGAVAARDVDLARSGAAASEAQLADAQSRLASVEDQLADTVIRSPISGVVASRPVHAGDVVTPGLELFTIVDPSSMRLDASVPSESLSELRVGARVDFEVRGYPERFTGRIERMAPRTDPVTRQLPIYVSISNAGGRLVGGLFAEGRVVTGSATGLVVPVTAINTTGPTPWALRVVDGMTERVDVSLGLRDPRTERVEVTAGLSDGDIVLRGAAQGIAPGTAVQVALRE